MLRFILRFDPPGELDDAFADGADVDGAFAEYRIVAEGLEHALLERLVVFLRLDLVLLVLLEILVLDVGIGASEACARALANP